MKHIIASFLCKLCKEQAAQPGIFTAGEVSWNMGISIHVSCTAYKRTAPQRGILVFFLQDSTKTTFLNENLNHRRTRTGHLFSQNQGTYLLFSKKAGETFSPFPSLVACLWNLKRVWGFCQGLSLEYILLLQMIILTFQQAFHKYLFYSLSVSLHKELSFPLRVSSLNVTKSGVSCRFGHIY